MDLVIKKATEIEQKKGTYLIYGNPGMGKTTTIKFLPGKTLVLDVDRTSHVLKGCENVDIVEIDLIDTWDSWSKILISLQEVANNYDNIVVDNVSELERCILADLGRKGSNKGVPSQGDYQYMQFKIVDSLRFMKRLNLDLIWTAWETTDRYVDSSGQEWSRSFPQINKKIINNVLGLCDVVGKMLIDKDGRRGFTFEATNSTYAKNQLDDRKGCVQDELTKIKKLPENNN